MLNVKCNSCDKNGRGCVNILLGIGDSTTNKSQTY